MTLYTTPLQFGYFFALVMALVLWFRSVRQERLSDRFLGWVMFFIAMQLQDYTFGFAGINYLWNELNGFPRGVDLLFGPAVYFYFKSQTNSSFRTNKKYLIHLLPWGVYFTVEFTVFLFGQETVNQFNSSNYAFVLNIVHEVVRTLSLLFYLWKSLKIYRAYRLWSENQFSDIELISFKWFRNFLYFMIAWIACREIINQVDGVLNLNFYQDWWWNLPLVLTAFYVGLQGYAQQQPQIIHFEEKLFKKPQRKIKEFSDKKNDVIVDWDYQINEQQLYLQSDLNLNELSKYLGVTPREISTYINEEFQVNFNDYINQKRVQAFEQKILAGSHKNFTLLSIAYDCGFNSKATFHRAFKKHKQCTPKEFIEGLKI